MGCYIVEFEQNGEDRAAYGEQLLKKLEQRLNVKGLNERRFREFRRLYLVYPQLKEPIAQYILAGSEIRHTLSAEFADPKFGTHCPPNLQNQFGGRQPPNLLNIFNRLKTDG